MYFKFPNNYFYKVEDRDDLDIIIDNDNIRLDLLKNLEDEIDEEYAIQQVGIKI